jgi:hypothetical protein
MSETEASVPQRRARARTAPPRTAWLVAWAAVGVVAGLGIVVGLGAIEGDDGQDVILGVTAAVPATAVGVAAVCYLAAAATGRRWMGWAALPVASALPALEYAGIPRWASFGVVGLGLLAYGLARHRPATAAQAAAMVAYYGVAVAATALPPRVGLVVAALALGAHVAWDVVHYRRDVVVPRSLTVFCLGLDVTAAALCVAFAVAA